MTNNLTDINEAKVKKYVESIRPVDPEIRKQVDIDYSFDGNTFELFEIRPQWNDSTEMIKSSFAKIRYYKSRNEYNLYWMRASGKWELYEPFPTSKKLEAILEVIKEDAHACFFG